MITAFKPRQPKYNVYFMSRFSLAFSDAPIFIDKKRVEVQFSVSLGSKTFLSPISPPHSPSLSFPVRQWPEQSGSWGWRFQTPSKPLSATFLLTHSSLCTSLSLERKVNELRERERETRVTERKLCCTWNEQRIAHNVFFL